MCVVWKKGWRGEVAWTRFDSMPIIAVEGCCHGELDSIYASVALAEERSNCKVDALLIGGDFQAVRNPADLATMRPRQVPIHAVILQVLLRARRSRPC